MMIRKLSLLFATALLLSMLVVPVQAGDWPQVTGTYVGKAYMFADPTTFHEGEMTVKIFKQVGPVFHGEKSWFNKSLGYEYSEPFAGTVCPDGSILVGEHDGGYMMGKLSGNKLVLNYVEGGFRHKSAVYDLMKK